MRRFTFSLLATMLAIAAYPLAKADTVQASPDGFQLKLEDRSRLSPKELFRKIGNLPEWWEDDHTYSGDADNLSLTGMKPGKLWLETWKNGRVQHGRVIAMTQSETERMIRFDAPLGPLQNIGVNAILTITVLPETDPETPEISQIRIDYYVTGASFQDLHKWADTVDGVLRAQLDNLIAP